MKQEIRVTESEWLVMEPLWDRSPLSAQEVIKALRGSRNWKPQTVKTLLGRLVKKQALSFETEGNRYLYTPIISRDEAVQAETDSFLGRICRNSLLPLLTHSIESERKLDKTEIDALRQLLENQKPQK